MNGINKDNKKIQIRLNKIIGQLEGIRKMIIDDKYCIDIIVQTSAVKSAISSLESEMLHSHLSHCLIAIYKKDDIKKLQTEMLKIYKLKNK